MDYNMNNLIPFIPPSEYDRVAEQFLEEYCPEALKHPMAVPIEKIAADMGLKVQYVCLSEEADIYGATIFTDGALEIYDPEEGLYDTKVFKRKTVLIDPEAVKKTNVGCKHNTLAHECVHWYKHRLYYKMQKQLSICVLTFARMTTFWASSFPPQKNCVPALPESHWKSTCLSLTIMLRLLFYMRWLICMNTVRKPTIIS